MKNTNREHALDVISEIALMTDENDHTGALIHLAEYLNETRKLEKLREIMHEHDRVGYLSCEASKKRSALGELLMLSAKSYFRMNDEFDLHEKLREAF